MRRNSQANADLLTFTKGVINGNLHYLYSGKHPEAVAPSCSVKKVFLEISQNSQENTCVRPSFLIKLQAKACNLLK